MRLITRSVTREIVPPFLLGVFAYTFLLVLRSLLQVSEMILRRDTPFSQVAKLLLLTLPQVLVLTIPMGFLLAILIGIGRLSGDSEIIALAACGVPRRRLLRGLAPTAGVLFIVVLYLSVWGYPRANAELARMENRLFATAALDIVRPRTFADVRAASDWVLYVDRDNPAGAGWRGVFLVGKASDGRQSVVVADSGEFRVESGRLWLDLRDADNHVSDENAPDVYDTAHNATQSILLREAPQVQGIAEAEKGLREQTLPELVGTMRRHAVDAPSRARLALVEIHKKLAIAFAVLVFAFVGLPLGISNRRGGRGSGFAVSIAIIIVYYVLLNNGETWAGTGRLSPAIAMWLPNLLLVLFGLGLYLRAPRERQNWVSFLRNRFADRRKGRDTLAGPHAEVRPAPLRAWRFPASLDRYVLSRFLATLVAIEVSVVFLYILIDYSDHAEDIFRRHISLANVTTFYRALTAPILVTTVPFCILLAALVALGSLCRHNEDLAFKACGVPLARLGLPILAMALLASGAAYATGEYVLPASNRTVHRVLAMIKGHSLDSDAAGASGSWLIGESGRIWNFDSADGARKEIWRPSVFEFGEAFTLRRRLVASKARWDGARWILEDGWERTFSRRGEESYTRFATLPLSPGDPPRLFARDRRRPEEMRYRELDRYVSRLRRTGYPVSSLATALAGKPAVAFQSMVLALLAIPFAFTLGRRGTLTGIGIGLTAGMVFLVVAAIFTKMGELGSLPPLLAAWAPNLMFALLGGARLLRLRT